jgi:transketolase
MRAAFVEAMKTAIPRDDRLILLLGDIGVHAMRDVHPAARVINFGIREQGMVNVAAGLATQGFYPIVHTIEPFLCERALEQIKLFAYNGLKGMFVTVGGSYDYSGLGCTHHCPAGPGNMLAIPGMQVLTPSTSKFVDCVFNTELHAKGLTYMRLVDGPQGEGWGSHYMLPGEHGEYPAIITTGTLDRLVDTTVKRSMHIHLSRLDDAAHVIRSILASNCGGGGPPVPNRILLVEEWYSGTITHMVTKAFYPRPILIQHVGVPRQFLTEYGTKAEIEARIGLTTHNIAMAMELLHHA